jgi:hypothetical protein
VSKTILELIGMEPVNVYTSKHGEDKEAPNPELIVGLELEIELFPFHKEHQFGGMSFTTDGSLRNNGMEIITKPVKSKHVPDLLNAFFRHFEIKEDENYSDRCSTHCHVNVQNLSLEQLSAVCLVYQTTERLLFHFIGDDRVNNIYCVPWCQSGLTYNVVNKLKKDYYLTFKRWQKYSALNLIPVHSQGTIEFRHLGGTCDVKKITQWISLIGQMFNYCCKTPLEDVKQQLLAMNTVSNYREWLYQVFGNHADCLDVSSGGEALLSKGVIDSKIMLMEDVVNITAPDIEFDDPPPGPEDFRDYDDEEINIPANTVLPQALNNAQFIDGYVTGTNRGAMYAQDNNYLEQLLATQVVRGTVAPRPRATTVVARTTPNPPRNPFANRGRF